MSIKSVLSVAVILGLTCAQVQAGPKRYPWGDRTSGRDLDVYRYDTREADRLRAEWEAESYDNGDPNKGWTYDVLSMSRSLSGYLGHCVSLTLRHVRIQSGMRAGPERKDRIDGKRST